MFEALLQRLLNRILGDYIENFNTNDLNVSPISGEIVIRNVSLKADVIRMLNLPLSLKYSRIQCLRIKVPWTSIASSPMEIELTGVFILISEVPKAAWQCKNDQIVLLRRKQIASISENLIKEFEKKLQKNTEKDQGYFSKLTVKIIDNIQVTIKDIHVRFEDLNESGFSFGFTLKQLKMFTVNAKGQPEFIQRSSANATQPIRKQLQLIDFGLYWNEKGEIWFGKKNEELASLMTTLGSKVRQQFIIVLCFKANLLQRQFHKDVSDPEIQLSMQFKAIDLELSRQQLQQIVGLVERLQEYSAEVKRLNRIPLSEAARQKAHSTFSLIFPALHQDKMTPENNLELDSILEKVEPTEFESIIRKHLEKKELQKLIVEKEKKSAGWFSGPKSITNEEKAELEKFMKENFPSETVPSIRPADYFFFQTSLCMDQLSVSVKTPIGGEEGNVRMTLFQIKSEASVRTGGYKATLSIDDIEADWGLGAAVKQLFLKKTSKVPLSSQISEQSQYIYISLEGSPLDRPHLNSVVQVKTSELTFSFSPRIGQILSSFSKLKLSQANTEKMIEKYGQLKQATSDVVAKSIETSVKRSLIEVDVKIHAITVILPESNGQWLATIGFITFSSDNDLMKLTEIATHEPLNRYNFALGDLKLNYQETNQPIGYQVIQPITVNALVNLFPQASEQIPKCELMLRVTCLPLRLQPFTLTRLLAIGDCFQVPAIAEFQEQQKTEKMEIMKTVSKLGVVHLQSNSLGDQWIKYIAAISGPYLYLYSNKGDQSYATYYYLKNSATAILPMQTTKHLLRVENSINKFTLGFESAKAPAEWKEVIDACHGDIKLPANPTQHSLKPPQVNARPNVLNFVMKAEFERLELEIAGVKGNPNKKFIFTLEGALLNVFMRQQITETCMSLKSLEMKDNLYEYKSSTLAYIAYTPKTSENLKLIDISIRQPSERHPTFNGLLTQVSVNFGCLNVNYKTREVHALLKIVTGYSSSPAPVVTDISSSSISSTAPQSTQTITLPSTKPFMKVSVSIRQLSLSLLNGWNSTLIGTLQSIDCNNVLLFSKASLLVQGTLQELSYQDLSCYPDTIIEQQASYQKGFYIVRNSKKNNNLLSYDAKMLSYCNEDGKNMLVDVKIAGFKVNYRQQPVLRVIAYLMEQLLPSIDTGASLSMPINTKDIEAPKPSKMKLSVSISDTRVILEPFDSSGQQLQLHVKGIEVSNQSSMKPYNRMKIPNVLVEVYAINITDVTLSARKKTCQEILKEYSLTSPINMNLTCDLIANSLFEMRRLGNDFMDGMRIMVRMSPFYMRLNHEEYNFVMKCLYWTVLYDDNADPYLRSTRSQSNPSSPLYFDLKMESISLFVYEALLPTTYLLLTSSNYSYESTGTGDSSMKLVIGDLLGSIIEHPTTGDISIEYGCFNRKNYKRSLSREDILNPYKSVELFQKEFPASKDQSNVVFIMSSTANGDTNISLTLNEVSVSAPISQLLKLSQIAILEKSIYPPPPKLQRKTVEKQPMANQTMSINIICQNILLEMFDKSRSNFLALQTETDITLITSSMLEPPTVGEDMQFPEFSTKIIKVPRLHVFYYEKKNPETSRQILSPFFITTQVKDGWVRKNNKLFSRTYATGEIGKIDMAVTLKDVIAIMQIISDNTVSFGASEPQPQKAVAVLPINRAYRYQLLIQPLLMTIINNCAGAFLPTIRVKAAPQVLALQGVCNDSEMTAACNIGVQFFNPRSAAWQPVLETCRFEANQVTTSERDGVKKILSLSVPQTSEVKLNLSSQFISCMLETQRLLLSEKIVAANRTINSASTVVNESSPYIIQNCLDKPVVIRRDKKFGDFKLAPYSRAPVDLEEVQNVLRVLIAERTQNINLVALGLNPIPNSPYFVNLDTEKLSRVIRLCEGIILINQTTLDLIVLVPDRQIAQVKVDRKGGRASFPRGCNVKISFGGKSATNLFSLSRLGSSDLHRAENGKFLILSTCQKTPSDCLVVRIKAPIVICNCLPMTISLQILTNSQLQTTKEFLPFESQESFACQNITKMGFKVRLGENYYWTLEFHMRIEKDNKDNKEEEISAQDSQGRVTKFKYKLVQNKSKSQYMIVFFCDAYIKSQFQEPVEIYSSAETETTCLAGQGNQYSSKIIILSPHISENIKLCGYGCNPDFSTPLNTSAYARADCRIPFLEKNSPKNRQLFLQVGANIVSRQTSDRFQFFSKEITIFPRRIISNLTDLDFLFRNSLSTDDPIGLLRKSNCPMLTTIPICEEIQQKYEFIADTKRSKPIAMITNTVSFFSLPLQPIARHFKVTTKEEGDFFLTQVTEIAARELPYRIVVNSKVLKVKVLRPGAPGIMVDESNPYYYLFEAENKEQFIFNITFNSDSSDCRIILSPNDVNLERVVHLASQIPDAPVNIRVRFQFFGRVKGIIIEEIQANLLKPLTLKGDCLLFKVCKLTLSIIDNHESVQRPFQSFLVSLLNLEAMRQKTTTKTIYQMKLQFIQIDQQHPNVLNQAVILTPEVLQSFISDKAPKFMLNSIMEVDLNQQDEVVINNMAIDLNNFVIKINKKFLKVVNIIKKEYEAIIGRQAEGLKVETERWKKLQLQPEGKITIIKKLILVKFTVKISISIDLHDLNDSDYLPMTVLSAMGNIFANMDGIPFDLYGKELVDVVATPSEIIKQLSHHYQNSVRQQLYKVVGGMNIFGSPTELFSSFSAGVKELKERPAEGLVNGPLELGIGIAKGASSFVALSTGGIFNSLSKATGAISSGLAAISFDEKFEADREKSNIERPVHIIDGIGKGGMAIFQGFKQGIVGLGRRPYEMAQKDGGKGFMRGMAQGVAGLILKPVSGVFEAASLTTAGIKNSLTYFENRPNEFRMREPRPFYTRASSTKEYEAIDAIALKVYSQDKETKEDGSFVNYSSSTLEGQRLLILEKQVILVDTKELEIVWSLEMENLTVVNSPEYKALRFTERKQQSFFSKFKGAKEYVVSIPNESERFIILRHINESKELMGGRK